MVMSFKGDGEGIFVLRKEEWIAAFGDTQGTMLDYTVEQEKRNAERDILRCLL